MPRARVLSFMSQWAYGPPRSPSSPSSPTFTDKPNANVNHSRNQSFTNSAAAPGDLRSFDTPPNVSAEKLSDYSNQESPAHRERAGSRPPSMMMTYIPPTIQNPQDTLPELQPIFSYLNGHTNKLYQEGYFLKLHDLDSRGRPSVDRVWNECFAQLVGTVLSLWDAAQLDAAGEDGEVIPTFINLTDASIKMIESLPMNGQQGQSLQNVLSISTAANNRYLLHFNSLHSLTQWTAGIRLAMFEHGTLQEAYTGSILAGKGKHLNNIRNIMERSRFAHEDWARVRFGAGTPWRRCWCVISPPDEKEFQKAQKTLKKRSAYERGPIIVKGDIKFYDTRKVTKKTKPIASITDGHAAYALYPQSKELIEQSTLVKVEGKVTIHSHDTTAEGFVFVMPEVHPAVSGFEIMLKWLIPVFDTFGLYGRPTRLIADTTDTRSLMFAMPNGSPYGHLELIDVSGLIHTEGSSDWTEREWRKQMKLLTSKRMSAGLAPTAPLRANTGEEHRRVTSRSSLNLPSARSIGIKFGSTPTHSSPASRQESPARDDSGFGTPTRVDSAPPTANGFRPPPRQHQRAASDAHGYRRESPSNRPSIDNNEAPPAPPPHVIMNAPATDQHTPYPSEDTTYHARHESSTQHDSMQASQTQHGLPTLATGVAVENRPFRPVAAPPTMAHKSSAQPPVKPAQMPDLRRANSAIDAATLEQLRQAQQYGSRPMDDAGEQLPVRARDDTRDFMVSDNGVSTYQNGHPNALYHIQQYSDTQATQQSYAQQNYAQQMAASQHYLQNNSSSASQQMLPNRRPGALPTNDFQFQQSSGSGRKLPTIPGTPAFEQDNFHLAPQEQTLEKKASSGSISRKPVPEN